MRFLGEGSFEVRNQAKLTILTLSNVCGTQRELDGILLKARLNDNQIESVRKVLASDFESISNYANTRYGASMRSSPLQNGRQTQYGDESHSVADGKHKSASGSDGFHRKNNMQ